MRTVANSFALLAAVLFATVNPALAAPINSDLDPALTGSTLIDFEAGPAGNNLTSRTISGVTFTVSPGADTASPTFSIDSDFAGDFNTRGELHITNHGDEFQVMRFDFSSTVSAFGFLWGASDASWTLQAFDAGDNLLESRVVPPVFASNAGDFFGLAVAGIDHAILTQNFDGIYADGGIDYVFIDDFRFVSGDGPPPSTGVPGPTSVLLLGLGLTGMAVARRFSRN